METLSQTGLGRQLLIEAKDCQTALDDVQTIEQLGLTIAELAKVTVLHKHTHHFSPQGISSVLVLAESHLAIHTWPEHNFFSLDLFTCGVSLPEKEILAHLQEALHTQKIEHQLLTRGHL